MLPNIKHNRFFLISFAICLLVIIGLCFAVAYRLWDIKTPIIVHFDAYKGIDILGSKAEVFAITLGAFAIILLNAFLADILYQRDRFLAYIVAFSNMAFTCLIFIGVSVILGSN